MFSRQHPGAASALLTFMLVLGMLVTAGSGGAGASDVPTQRPRPARAPVAPAGQPLVVLLRDHSVRSAPRASARRISSVRARRPLTHVHTVLPVLGRAANGRWVHVRLPGRPNGHAGWISADGTKRRATNWRITVRLKQRLVIVSRGTKVQGRFRAVIGRPDAPTPRGRFFVEEGVPLKTLGAPYALALSSRSTVYDTFAGGPGQVALHGTTGVGGVPGTAGSHGCVRLSPRAMRWLSKRIGPGVPLIVRR